MFLGPLGDVWKGMKVPTEDFSDKSVSAPSVRTRPRQKVTTRKYPPVATRGTPLNKRTKAVPPEGLSTPTFHEKQAMGVLHRALGKLINVEAGVKDQLGKAKESISVLSGAIKSAG